MTTHAPSGAAVDRGSPEPEFVAAPLPCIDDNEVRIRAQLEWEQAWNKLPQAESPTDACGLSCSCPHVTDNEAGIRAEGAREEAGDKLQHTESPTDACSLFCPFSHDADGELGGLPLYELQGNEYDLFDEPCAEAQAPSLAEPAMAVQSADTLSGAGVAPAGTVGCSEGLGSPSVESRDAVKSFAEVLLPPAESPATESAYAESTNAMSAAAESTDAKSADAEFADAKSADAKSADAKSADAKSADAKSPAAKPATAVSPAAESPAAEPAAGKSTAFKSADAKSPAAKPATAVSPPSESPAAEPAPAESTHAEAPTAKSALAFVPYPSFQLDINEQWGDICDNFFKRLEAFPAVLRALEPEALLRCPPLGYTIKNAPKDVRVFLYRPHNERVYCHSQNTVGRMASNDDWPIIFKGKPTYMSAVVEDCENSVQALGSTAKASRKRKAAGGFASAVGAARLPQPPAPKAQKPPPPATKAQKPPPPATKAHKPPPPPPAPAAGASRKRKAGEGFGNAVSAVPQPEATEAAGMRQRQSEGPPCVQAATNSVLAKRERKQWKPSHI